jgi:LacI family transcriptional regulator
MGITLKDVAKLAGVSIGTASQSLNNKICISLSTRERVLLSARKLNYYPHTIAKQLALQRLII